ncbi:copper amine oxidase [Aspergillus insuetus]
MAYPSAIHPLDPLTSDEILLISGLLRKRYGDIHVKSMAILEPPKRILSQYLAAERTGQRNERLPRHAKISLHRANDTRLYLICVAIVNQTVQELSSVDDPHLAQLDVGELAQVRDACLRHPRVIDEVRKFGLPEGTEVICDTWPYGRDTDEALSRRIQCYLYARNPQTNHEASNHYDNPLPFSPLFDIGTLELIDITFLPTGADSVVRKTHYQPRAAKEYHQDLRAKPTRTDLKPLLVRQPQGPSFQVEGQLITWQKWRFRLGFNWREGMTLHDVTYDGRELFYRLSLSEMFVPYGDPRSPYSRKSVFDVGDIGAGIAANDLKLGCDCLGYFSFALSGPRGEVLQKDNAVCMHEIDNGIGWKHTNTLNGLVSIVRARVLVLQTIITVGNYEYIFAWHFDQAAGLHYQIQATGILSTVPIDHGVQVPWGTNVNEGVMAPNHQHVFCLRIDPAIDGHNNTFVEEDSLPMLLNHDNPLGVGFITTTKPLLTSGTSEFALNRVHKIINQTQINKSSGKPVAYAIHSPARQMLLAHPQSWHSKRAAYSRHPFWVTRHHDDELYAAGEYTYQSLPPVGAKGVATWAERGDCTEDADIVVWHSVPLTHNPRVEDYPVMPCDTMTVSLKPSGFFEGNPALDVPQSTQMVNQSVLYEDVVRVSGGSCCSPRPSLQYT